MKTYEERMDAILGKAREKKRKRRLISLCVTGAVITAMLLVLFVPYSTTPPSVARYANSPYYDVIQSINVYQYEAPRYRNNFEALAGFANSLDGVFLPGKDTMEPAGDRFPTNSPEAVGAGGSYVEVTDNQVAGVIEADVFKRGDQYIYHLYRTTLSIYTIKGEGSERVASYDLQSYLPENTNLYNAPEMYLSQDCTTLTILLRVFSKMESDATVLINLDVTNPEKIEDCGHVLFAGDYISSRMVGGQLLLFYTTRIQSNVDFDDPATYVPRYGWFDALTCVDGEDIIVPDVMTAGNYTVACLLDGKTLELTDCKAMLSYAADAYVSRENIYFTSNSYWKVMEETGDKITTRLYTKVTGLSYVSGVLEETGSILVEGSIKDQYSMDELDGMLRLVTSTSNDRVEKNYGPYDVQLDIWWDFGKKSVNLYCIDLETWFVAGMVEGFAPAGEEATSVRFDGATAYVCTAELIQLTDPVYFFDLSDPANITWTDTGVIGGYSSSLVNFGENTLLGIGYDEARRLKVEIYRQRGDKVESVDCFTMDCGFSGTYKDYYIDREKGFLGLGVFSYETGKLSYLLLHFDGFYLTPEQIIPFEGDVRGVRADIIDDCLFILGENLTVVKL